MRWILRLLIAASTAQAQAPLFDRFFDEYYFRFYPTAGTSAGFHQYDSKLEDYSQTAVHQRIVLLRQFEKQFAALEPSADRELVLGKIRADLLELENIRQWETNPDIYSSGITNSVFLIMSRTFAPPAERLRSVIARENLMPAVFSAARENLKNPPRIYTEIAIEQLPGIIRFFDKDVPLAFREVHDTTLLADFQKSNQAVIGALRGYQDFLKTDLLPRSRGDFRIGPENYRRKLDYEEMVDIPLERLLKAGYANLRQNQEAFRQVAQKIDRNKTAMQILEDLQKDHPSGPQLLASFRGVLAGLRDFIVQHKIIDIPSPVMPIVEETPPFMLHARADFRLDGHARPV